MIHSAETYWGDSPKHPLKIAHLLPYFFKTIGGLQVCVHNLAALHVKKGHAVRVFHCDPLPKGYTTPYACTKIPNFRATRRYPMRRRFVTGMISRLQRHYQFDLWQINGGYPYGVLLADFFNRLRIPAVLRCSGDDIQVNWALDYGVRRDPLIDRAILNNYFKFPALVAITETVKHEYQNLGVPDERIFLIPNGVDLERFKINSTNTLLRSREHICRQHHLPQTAKIILTVGRNHPKKGYDRIPFMLKHIIEQGIDAYWIVIGKGCHHIGSNAYDDEIAKRLVLIEEIKSARRFEIPSNELIQYYRSTDVFAMTSKLETFGIVLVEAMAAGLPIVCFDVPGVRDIIHHKIGAICSPEDDLSFSRSLIERLSAVHTASKRGFSPDSMALDPPQGIDRSVSPHSLEESKKYSWHLIAEQYSKMYEQLLSKPSAAQRHATNRIRH